MELLLEQLAKSLDLISRSVLSESTLTKLMGSDAAGSNLARYVHRQFKVADAAAWKPTTVKNINWKMFSLDPQNLLLIKGANGWVFLKPVAENFHTSWKTQWADPDAEEASIQDRTTTFEYYWAYGDKEMSDAELAAADKDLEAGRHLRYGTSPNKNKYTDFPHVEKTDGIVKSRARMPKEILPDIIAKLHSIDSVWIADQRENTRRKQLARNDYKTNTWDPEIAKQGSGADLELPNKLRKATPNFYGGRMGKEGPDGASIEVAKIRNRAIDPKYRAGRVTVGAEGYDNLIAAVKPLASLIARRAMIEYKRKNRGRVEDPEDIHSLGNRIRRMNTSGSDYWFTGVMGGKMPYGLAGKLIKSKNKEIMQNINLLINSNNNTAKKWFIDLAVNHILADND